jgi:hypothetical protein
VLKSSQNQEPEYPVLDGFLLNAGLYKGLSPTVPALRCNLTFVSLALEQYDCLRRSKAYRSKQWVIPQDSLSIVIPARGSYEYELQVPVGSAIWGWIFTGFGTQNTGDLGGGFLTWKVTDACNNVDLVSEFVTKPSGDYTWKQQNLSKLYVVGAPGLLRVEIASTFSVDIDASNSPTQLVLCGGTPAWNEGA